jgi:predicted amidophosphoribosyltransferase
MKKIIKKFKYEKVYELKNILAEFLSDLYYRYFFQKDIDYIDTVPGKHTDLLAGCFSKKHGIPFLANIIRIGRPERQGGLGFAERKVNVLDCFKLKNCLSYNKKNILVIDDVWTTGNTLKEICRALKSGGVNEIYLLTLARRV